jgi:glycerol dehydrogenase-like iron-containing ADH family enzyme
VSEFGIDRARELAEESHRMAREALAEAAGAMSSVGGSRPAGTTDELEQITDFIYTRTS